MKKTLIWITSYFAFIFLISIPSSAFDEFKKWQEEEKAAFNTFLDENDKAFIDFLKNEWEAFQIFEGIVGNTAPKPIIQPVAEQPPEPDVKPDVTPLPQPEPDHEPAVDKKTPSVTLPEIVKSKPHITVSFFNTPVSVNIDPGFEMTAFEIYKKNAFVEYWEKMGATEYAVFVKQARTVKSRLDINDWGYLQFLYQTGLTLYRGDTSMASLFVWFMATKSGYDAKAGYSGSDVYLLFPSTVTIYNTPFLTFNGKRYYFFRFDEKSKRPGSIFTYDGSYPEAQNTVNYNIVKPPALSSLYTGRTLSFVFHGQKRSVRVLFNKNLVEYFRNYPQTDIKIYFDAAVSDYAKSAVLDSLRPLVEGQPELTAVNCLLKFVQTAFEYQTDDQQFNQEKYLLPEETFCYPYSDCEDRSILFAYLVKALTGLDVIGLKYPGHVATAVRFRGDVSGEYVMNGGKKFIICDPTYINALAGNVIPQCSGKKPEIVCIGSKSL